MKQYFVCKSEFQMHIQAFLDLKRLSYHSNGFRTLCSLDRDMQCFTFCAHGLIGLKGTHYARSWTLLQ